MPFVSLHSHSSYSLFDGFRQPADLVKQAKSLGHTAFGLTDHGNVCGLMELYEAAKSEGIKPIFGVEAYFQPKFEPGKDRYHLTVIAKDIDGYHNMMRMITDANVNRFHRVGIVDFAALKRYNKGLIVLSGCLAAFIPRLILKKKYEAAKKVIDKFLSIFGDDRFYLELQPISVIDNGSDIQKIVNEFLMKMSEKFGVRAVMTTDSHYDDKENYDSYMMMHKMADRTEDKLADYSKRYIMSEKEVRREWSKMHHQDPTEYINMSQKIADMCDIDLNFKEMIPRLDWGVSSRKKLTEIAVEFLKREGKWTKEYRERLKYELEIICEKKFEDYFLLCYDIVNFAKSKGIGVGDGRGSVCGSLLAYAIGLTNVDPIILGTNFERFMHREKNKMPDVDLDFDSNRRDEVIAYVLKRFEGRSAPISAFGYYKTKNLINDLAKVYQMDENDRDQMKIAIESIIGEANHAEMDAQMASVSLSNFLKNSTLRKLNIKYKNIVKHFANLYGQVKYIGRHAAGIAIANDDIDKYIALMNVRGNLQTSCDMNSLNTINVLKMDVLGLANVSIINEVNKLTGEKFTYDKLDDPVIYEKFIRGETEGIFQFEKSGAKAILAQVEPRNIQDLIACNALNRPAPRKLGVVDQFVEGKNGLVNTKTKWYPYTKDTYGTIVYQEQVLAICRNLAKMPWDVSDKITKELKQVTGRNENNPLMNMFVEGAMQHGGMKRKEAEELYEKMTLYLFNKGHGAAYALTAYYAMWLKHYYPLEFYYALLKNEGVEQKREVYKSAAVKDGVIILLPHVNGSPNFAIRKLDGERVLQEGLISIKGIGLKTAQELVKYKPYRDMNDFLQKVPRKYASLKVIDSLREAGALEFNKTRYLKRCERYNGSLYGKSLTVR